MCPRWAPQPSKLVSGSNVIGGFDSHAFPPIKKRNPVCKSDFFVIIASWLNNPPLQFFFMYPVGVYLSSFDTRMAKKSISFNIRFKYK